MDYVDVKMPILKLGMMHVDIKDNTDLCRPLSQEPLTHATKVQDYGVLIPIRSSTWLLTLFSWKVPR